VAAGDGWVMQINEPVSEDLNGRPAKVFRNRKGYFGLVAQAFCDAACRFIYFNVGWPGSTNDIIAYKQTKLYLAFENEDYPDWVAMVLDEAYSSIGGTHFTPFTKYQLERAYKENRSLYLQMRAYNHVLSMLRIHIERALGQLVRRWGILWRSSELRVAKTVVLVIACAKLHNLCVDRWIERNGEDKMYGSLSFELESILEHIDVPHMDPPPTDEAIIERFRNYQSALGRSNRAATCDDRRVVDMHLIYEAGIRIVDQQSLAGLPAVGDGVNEDDEAISSLE
jgi:hypothetical protein